MGGAWWWKPEDSGFTELEVRNGVKGVNYHLEVVGRDHSFEVVPFGFQSEN